MSTFQVDNNYSNKAQQAKSQSIATRNVPYFQSEVDRFERSGDDSSSSSKTFLALGGLALLAGLGFIFRKNISELFSKSRAVVDDLAKSAEHKAPEFPHEADFEFVASESGIIQKRKPLFRLFSKKSEIIKEFNPTTKKIMKQVIVYKNGKKAVTEFNEFGKPTQLVLTDRDGKTPSLVYTLDSKGYATEIISFGKSGVFKWSYYAPRHCLETYFCRDGKITRTADYTAHSDSAGSLAGASWKEGPTKDSTCVVKEFNLDGSLNRTSKYEDLYPMRPFIKRNNSEMYFVSLPLPVLKK